MAVGFELIAGVNEDNVLGPFTSTDSVAPFNAVPFVVLTLACWLQPRTAGTMMDGQRVAPWYGVLFAESVVFFNAQYYAQRVIGNYYIRKAQDYAKRGIERVDLHAF